MRDVTACSHQNATTVKDCPSPLYGKASHLAVFHSCHCRGPMTGRYEGAKLGSSTNCTLAASTLSDWNVDPTGRVWMPTSSSLVSPTMPIPHSQTTRKLY